jgi:hypothetical protein
MTLNYAVPYGNIKFVLFDARENNFNTGNTIKTDDVYFKFNGPKVLIQS